MNNTDKLLRAFIEASGYEIEEARSSDKATISKEFGQLRITQGCGDELATHCGQYMRGPDNCYYTKEIVTTDYKVTKRKSSCCIVNIEQDGEASFSGDDTPDYCSYPTQLKISIVDGGISVKQVGVNEEWTELNNENI